VAVALAAHLVLLRARMEGLVAHLAQHLLCLQVAQAAQLVLQVLVILDKDILELQ
jgi:hypothetical protein